METKYNKANWIQYTIGILVILSLSFSFIGYNASKSAADSVNAVTDTDVTNIVNAAVNEMATRIITELSTASDAVSPTAAEIAALINIPKGDTSRLCELTPGCEFYEPTDENHDGYLKTNHAVLLKLKGNNEAAEDFVEELSDLIGLDDDEFNLSDKLAKYVSANDLNDEDVVEYKEYQIRAYSESDADDDNWEIKIFARITYQDIDENDHDHVYVVITSVLDEGDYDSLSIEEVDRRFEF